MLLEFLPVHMLVFSYAQRKARSSASDDQCKRQEKGLVFYPKTGALHSHRNAGAF